jgi:ABC-type transporter Mla MlaB component
MFMCPKRNGRARFRVSIHHFAEAFELKLEGPLTASDAPGVEARWRTAASLIRVRPFRVDLQAVTTVDEAGRQLLDRMREHGAEFILGRDAARLRNEIGWTASMETTGDRELAGPLRALRSLPELFACLFSRLAMRAT